MDTGTDIFRVILLWAMNGSVLFAACIIAMRLSPQDRICFWIRTLVIYLSLIIIGMTWFGLLGWIKLSIIAPLSLLPGAYLIFRRFYRKRVILNFNEIGEKSVFLERAFSWMLLLGAIILFAFRLWTPDFEHDPLTYQLYFPGQWLASGRLDIVATPFGDNSRAYEPSGASLYYLWLMLPLRSDLFAQMGQVPFFILSLLSLAGISERLGVKSPWKYLPAVFFMCTPIVWNQAGSAENDLAMTSAFLALLYFTLGIKDRTDSNEDIPAALALGMLIGTKYLGITMLAGLLPVILYGLALLYRSGRAGFSKVILWLVLIFLTGGFWYLRNLAVTGNPLYPLEINLFGKVIFAGAYSTGTMKNWVFHLDGFSAQKDLLCSILSPVMLLTILASMFLGLAIHIWRRAGPLLFISCYFCILPIIIHLLNWYAVPFQVDRFWLPAIAGGIITIALVLNFFPAAGFLYFGILLVELFLRDEFQTIRIWQWPLFGMALIAGVVFAGARLRSRVMAGIIILAILFSLVVAHGYFHRRSEYFREKWEFGMGWNYIWGMDAPLRIAYSGSNVPYPLLGPGIENRVMYVNINKHSDWKFHDYGRWFWKESRWMRPNTPEPALYRLERNAAEWWENLRKAEADYIFVTRVGRNALLNIAHDERGWPVESIWAVEHPEAFRIVYEDMFVRIFSINRDVSARFSRDERITQTRPMDALAVYRDDPAALEECFPMAERVIEEYNIKAMNYDLHKKYL
jgi:hypothetical protein